MQGQPSPKPTPATPAWAACLGRCGTPALPGAGVKAAVGRAIQGPEGRAGAWEAGWRSFCSAGRAESPRAQKLLPGGTEGETEAAWAGSGRKGRRVGSAVVRQDSGSEVRALAGALTAGPRPGSRSLRPGPAGRRSDAAAVSVRLSAARTEEGKQELLFLSHSNPGQLERLCAHL